MRSTIGLAAMVAATMGGMGLDAEVVPRPQPTGTLGDWIARNNRRRVPKVKRAKPVRRARLQRATGPGSYDEWKAHVAADRRRRRGVDL